MTTFEPKKPAGKQSYCLGKKYNFFLKIPKFYFKIMKGGTL